MVVGGMALSGMSTTVVTPPKAAARVPVQKPSHSVRPGSLRCTWASTRPGSSIFGEWSTNGVPGGKSDLDRTEWKMDMILPVWVLITMVADVNRPDTTARDEARTVIGYAWIYGCEEGGGVPVAWGAIAGRAVGFRGGLRAWKVSAVWGHTAASEASDHVACHNLKHNADILDDLELFLVFL